MKRKVIFSVIGAVLVLGVVCAVVLSRPRAVFAGDTAWKIYRITAYDEIGMKEDITQQVADLDFLAESLLLMETGWLRTPFAPVDSSAIRYEISGTYGDETLHILLTDTPESCVVYESADRGGWRIHRAEYWLKLVDWLCTMYD